MRLGYFWILAVAGCILFWFIVCLLATSGGPS